MANKKILLIYPPVSRPYEFARDKLRVSIFFPLGLSLLGTVLVDNGYEVEILDCIMRGDRKETELPGYGYNYGLTADEIAREIKRYAPDVVGITCVFSAMEKDAMKVASIVKSVDPSLPVVVGGAHASSVPRKMLDGTDIDYVVIGEGELTLLELLEILFNQNGKFSAISGFAYTEGGEIVINEKKKYISNLDSLPIVRRDLLDFGKYLALSDIHSSVKQTPFTQVITSRGCPAKCTFCAIENQWGRRQRFRTAENVLQEIDMLVNRYGVREIHFEDDNFTADKERAIQIMEGLKKYNLSWTVPSGMAGYCLDEELLEAMADSGCYCVTIAVESGSERVLHKLMKKPLKLKIVPGLIEKSRALGMDVKGFFLIGYPGETRDEIDLTIEYAKKLELDWSFFSIFAPLPGTKIFQYCIDNGLIKEDEYSAIKAFHRPVITTPEWDPEYLHAIREKAIIECNFKYNVNLWKYDLNKAIVDIGRVVSLYPKFDFANLYLGNAYYKKGDMGNAGKYWSHAAEIDGELKVLALKKLDALSKSQLSDALWQE